MARFLQLTALFALLLTAALPHAAMAGEGAFAPLGLRLGSAPETPHSALRGESALRESPSFAGAIGLQLGPGIWLEGERLSRRVSIDEGFADTKVSLVNVSIQPESGRFTPFVTLGAGLSRHDGRLNDSAGFATGEGESGTSFAWQFGGGLQFRASEDMALTGTYRYLNGGAAGARSDDEAYDDHEFWLRANHDLPVRRNLEPLKGSKNYK